ncbi:alpha/beta fold hydrolase [Vibrio neptunius]|uniref:alpha/beta fold hydrolase n=1 Tax=Vibrio neptunius TaxID=170651 RepID=UPI0019D2C87B|nr:alpha/beta fold hydrolase [Vibrio neptunius]MBN3575694.1 alpha/beta fold hydrolase [Vibrio neptunius]QXX06319.1 alpha/beta fold hydrolase [Vibrio neptunius]
MSQLLNYKIEGEGHTIVLIHGLFGSLDNLGLLARDLRQDFQVVSVDLRNHGMSFQAPEHNYELMAQDVFATLQHLNLKRYILIGHSMGGKVAIKLAELAQTHVEKLLVLDMAPVAYSQSRHDNVFAGLKAVLKHKPTSRRQALEILAQHIEIEGVRQFLSKSLYHNGEHLEWRFNVSSLWDNYSQILGWNPIDKITTPTLLVKGGNSDYLTAEHQEKVQHQFTNVKAHVIANTGHWLHAEKPQEVLRAIRKFIT